MGDEVPWPQPPRDPGPWDGGPPVAPPGNTPLPPLPGAGGVVHGASPQANPWANTGVGSQAPGAQAAGSPFAGTDPSTAGVAGAVAAAAGMPGGYPPGQGAYGQQPHGGQARPRVVDRTSKLAVAAVLVVVLGIVGASVFLIFRDSSDYPAQWDPRVEPITQWVAKERQLAYEHPVKVNFLSEAEYTKQSTGGSKGPSKEERQQQADQIAQMRALGFVSGDFDMGKATDTLSDSGTLAYYDPQTKQVYVRGTKMTPALRVTLAHELTHVLQDQHFDLNRMDKMDSGHAAVLRALAEGDATAVEDAYVKDVLTSAERKEYESSSTKDSNDAQEKIDKDVPPILSTVFAAPYILGPELISYLKQDKSYAKVDEALKDPPSEEALFDPIRYGTDQAKDVKVDVSAPKGSTKIEKDEFGPTILYLMLATRLDPKTALAAVDGWGGDQYVVYRQGKQVCVDVVERGDDAKETAELQRALQAWVAKSPKGTASVSKAGAGIKLHSCDPGKEAKAAGGDASMDLLALPVTRTELYVQAVEQGQSPEKATCWAQGVLDAFTYAQLSDRKGTYIQSPAGQQKLLGVRESCR